MPFRHAALAIAALAALPSLAAGIATVTSVEGVATAVANGKATTLVAGMTLPEGARIVTTSSATASVRTNSGCALVVPPAHAVTLLSGMSCPQLQASLQPAGPNTAAMGQGRGDPQIGRGVDLPVAVWAAALGLATAYAATHNDDNTPLSGR